MTSSFSFTIDSECPGTWARAGTIQTPHGSIRTPIFMPVGTQATVKSVSPEELRAAGAQIILANTYHLMLRPGSELIASLGGLHSFMHWDGPILTDSGGFQVFSLGHLRKLSEGGATFKSHLDGSLQLLTPESVMSIDPELREQSARFICNLPFPGFAIGGLSVGEPKAIMWEMLRYVTPVLPRDKPRHLLGVGSPEDLVLGVGLGMDMFDCVLPTRVARHGGLFTPYGRVNIKSARWRAERGPIEEGCDCYTCRNYSAAYVHHLARTEEQLYYRLGSIHNIRFMVRLANHLREAIIGGSYAALRDDFMARYIPASEEVREEQREKCKVARRN